MERLLWGVPNTHMSWLLLLLYQKYHGVLYKDLNNGFKADLRPAHYHILHVLAKGFSRDGRATAATCFGDYSSLLNFCQDLQQCAGGWRASAIARFVISIVSLARIETRSFVSHAWSFILPIKMGKEPLDKVTTHGFHHRRTNTTRTEIR